MARRAVTLPAILQRTFTLSAVHLLLGELTHLTRPKPGGSPFPTDFKDAKIPCCPEKSAKPALCALAASVRLWYDTFNA